MHSKWKPSIFSPISISDLVQRRRWSYRSSHSMPLLTSTLEESLRDWGYLSKFGYKRTEFYDYNHCYWHKTIPLLYTPKVWWRCAHWELESHPTSRVYSEASSKLWDLFPVILPSLFPLTRKNISVAVDHRASLVSRAAVRCSTGAASLSPNVCVQKLWTVILESTTVWGRSQMECPDNWEIYCKYFVTNLDILKTGYNWCFGY